mmetsp:Transcript_38562/g.44422  ORF Transcript_38562/g.44422 Transcript_38562/m.44422 type:complete len:334 (+) Transcript_38562:222-1223(+)
MSTSTATTPSCMSSSTTSCSSSSISLRSSLLNDPRSCILRVGSDAGKLCYLANKMRHNTSPSSSSSLSSCGNGTGTSLFCGVDVGSNNNDNNNKSKEEENEQLDHEQRQQEALELEFIETLKELFVGLWFTSQSLRLNWISSIRSKMELNAKKYPIEHCKGSSQKYTEYSHLTGITKTENQSTIHSKKSTNHHNNNSNHDDDTIIISLKEFTTTHLTVLCDDLETFAADRLWTKYHQPRNLIMALLGEVGELSELLQFDGDDDIIDNDDNNDNSNNTEDVLLPLPLSDRLQLPENSMKLDKLSQELADVSIYALRLITICDVVELVKEALEQE